MRRRSNNPPHWEVTNVTPVAPLTLAVRFMDGPTGTVRVGPSHLRGVFTALKDPDFFNRVYVDGGAVTWPSDIDLAPDAMYDEIKEHAEWVLR